jgi:hypothetical protein
MFKWMDVFYTSNSPTDRVYLLIHVAYGLVYIKTDGSIALQNVTANKAQYFSGHSFCSHTFHSHFL